MVVATRDRPELLRDALIAIQRASSPADELLVVDSASRDPSVGDVARSSGATVLRCKRAGASRARNAGAAAASGAVIAFTDDDCRPRPGWTAALARPFADPAVGFVVGSVVLEAAADTGSESGVSLLTDLVPRTFGGAVDPKDVGHGANLGVRREAFEAVGGFDEGLGPGTALAAAEDHDLFWRLLRSGWRGIYEPAAVVVHHQWRGRLASLAIEYRYGVGSGAVAAKVRRLDRKAGGRMLRRRIWTDGSASALRNLRHGYGLATARDVVRLGGVAVGAVRGTVAHLHGSHFGPGLTVQSAHATLGW